MTYMPKSSLRVEIPDFTLSLECLKAKIGLTWENNKAQKELMVSLKNWSTRNVTVAIVIFLFKLRTGNSNAVIASAFGFEREQLISDVCDSKMSSFEKDILPVPFGFCGH